MNCLRSEKSKQWKSSICAERTDDDFSDPRHFVVFCGNWNNFFIPRIVAKKATWKSGVRRGCEQVQTEQLEVQRGYRQRICAFRPQRRWRTNEELDRSSRRAQSSCEFILLCKCFVNFATLISIQVLLPL